MARAHDHAPARADRRERPDGAATARSGPPIGNRAFSAMLARQPTAEKPKRARVKPGGRPDSKVFWAAYDKVKYNPNPVGSGPWTGLAQEEAWDFIGGHIGNAFGPHGNSCAARLSFGLNYGGSPIAEYDPGYSYPNPSRVVDKKGKSHKPGDDKLYIVSSPVMEEYLTKKWGKADAQLKTNDDAKIFAGEMMDGQVAVFSGSHHTGVIVKYTQDGYKDAYVFSDPAVVPVSVWMLPSEQWLTGRYTKPGE